MTLSKKGGSVYMKKRLTVLAALKRTLLKLRTEKCRESTVQMKTMRML